MMKSRSPKQHETIASPSSRRSSAGVRLLHLDLTEEQVALIDKEAARLGMARVRWVRAFMDAHLRNIPAFRRDDELLVIRIHSEARFMRNELTTIRKALQASEAPVSVAVVDRLDELHGRLDALQKALRDAFNGNLRYWKGVA